MRTQEVIETIRWIDSQIPNGLSEWLFPLHNHKSTEDEEHADPIRRIVATTRFFETVSANAQALQVLEAFGLTPFVNRNEFDDYIQFVTHRIHRQREDNEGKASPTLLETIISAWHCMIDSAVPLERLTTPRDMQTPDLPETFISFELADIANRETTLSRLAKATTYAEDAYEIVIRVYGIDNSEKLSIVKVESGSLIRIDCRGLGEPIKHLKNLILEAWHKFRHKRSEEVMEKNKAAFSSLAVIEEINHLEQNGSIAREEAEQLRRNLILSIGGLFECGVLIAEIPANETVENTKLLEGFIPKRLSPPALKKPTAKKQGRQRKRATPKRRVKKA